MKALKVGALVVLAMVVLFALLIVVVDRFVLSPAASTPSSAPAQRP